jgi:hypothetical protein
VQKRLSKNGDANEAGRILSEGIDGRRREQGTRVGRRCGVWQSERVRAGGGQAEPVSYLRDFSSESLARRREEPTTRLVIVSRDNRKTLALVQSAIAELDGWRPDASRDSTYSVMMRDKRRLIVINLVRGARAAVGFGAEPVTHCIEPDCFAI